jgi:hypothetical protein
MRAISGMIAGPREPLKNAFMKPPRTTADAETGTGAKCTLSTS